MSMDKYVYTYIFSYLKIGNKCFYQNSFMVQFKIKYRVIRMIKKFDNSQQYNLFIFPFVF